MKNFAKITAVAISSLLLLGAVAVSADEAAEVTSEVVEEITDETAVTEVPAEPEEEEEAKEVQDVQVSLIVEGIDGLVAQSEGVYPNDESVSAGDVIAALLSKDYPDMEIVGVEDGYISSVDGIAAGTFGGYDGWLYVVRFESVDEDGSSVTVTEMPTVGVNDYMISEACEIVLYYGDYDDALAGYYMTEDNFVKLVSYTAVYDEEYNFVGFEEAPLAGGSIDLFPVVTDETTGEVTYGDAITFVADENGVTALDSEYRAVENGDYLCVISKLSDETATVGDVTYTKPEVVRYTFDVTVDNQPTPEELFKAQLMVLMIGFGGPRG